MYHTVLADFANAKVQIIFNITTSFITFNLYSYFFCYTDELDECQFDQNIIDGNSWAVTWELYVKVNMDCREWDTNGS